MSSARPSLQNGEDALQACAALDAIRRRSATGDAIEFMQQLLEPQLVHLVNDDE
jgi:hypothetical protein